MLNQFGFVLVAASLVDTFIVRTLVVPALMFYAVESNWWPGRVPPPVHTSWEGKDCAESEATAQIADTIAVVVAVAKTKLRSSPGKFNPVVEGLPLTAGERVVVLAEDTDTKLSVWCRVRRTTGTY